MHQHMRKDLSSSALEPSWCFYPLTQQYKIMFYIKANHKTFVKHPNSAKGAVLDTVGVMLMYFYS